METDILIRSEIKLASYKDLEKGSENIEMIETNSSKLYLRTKEENNPLGKVWVHWANE